MTSLNNIQLHIAPSCQRLLEPLIQTTYIKNNMIRSATCYCPNCNKQSHESSHSPFPSLPYSNPMPTAPSPLPLNIQFFMNTVLRHST
jgi:hypothetical protein